MMTTQETMKMPMQPPKRKVLTEKSVGRERSIAENVFVPGGVIWLVRHSNCSLIECFYLASTVGRQEIFRIGKNEDVSMDRNILYAGMDSGDIPFFMNKERVSVYTSKKKAEEMIIKTHIPMLITFFRRRIDNRNVCPKRRHRLKGRVSELNALIKKLARENA